MERFAQIAPKIVFSTNAIVYNAKVHAHLDKLRHVCGGTLSAHRRGRRDETPAAA